MKKTTKKEIKMAFLTHVNDMIGEYGIPTARYTWENLRDELYYQHNFGLTDKEALKAYRAGKLLYRCPITGKVETCTGWGYFLDGADLDRVQVNKENGCITIELFDFKKEFDYKTKKYKDRGK
jgi:hypothetical protein